MRYVMAALAIATCPCHLPVLLVLLGGTALGAALGEHMAVVFITLTVLFGLSAWAALRMFSQSGTGGREARPATTPKIVETTREGAAMADKRVTVYWSST